MMAPPSSLHQEKFASAGAVSLFGCNVARLIPQSPGGGSTMARIRVFSAAMGRKMAHSSDMK
jgi:hypothetical protein